MIDDFRANDGAVDQAMGGFFKGKPLLILHSTGAKTGKRRVNPLVYATHHDSYVVAASKGGAPYAKLVAIMPDQYGPYETMTDRRIPVVVLDRAD